MSRPSAADLQRHPWVRKAQPPQEEQEQSATILELRKFSRSRGRGTGGMLMVRRHLSPFLGTLTQFLPGHRGGGRQGQ